MKTPNAVGKVNQLSARWAETYETDQSVVSSGLGVWILLATLLRGADGSARNELESATGLSQSEVTAGVESLLESINGVEGLRSALAVWVRDSIKLLPEFVSNSSGLTIGAMPETQTQFDQWASKATDGLIDKFPIELKPDSLLVLGSAILAKGSWEKPFREQGGLLSVKYYGLEKAAVVKNGDSTICRVVITGKGDLDVHLVAGKQTDSPGSVISAGMAELLGEAEVVPGEDLKDGENVGCLRARFENGFESTLQIWLPQFKVSSVHDLKEEAKIFGLESCGDVSKGHFPGISDSLLAVGEAAQSATMAFGPKGFEAAAVTAIRAVAGAKMSREKCLVLTAGFDGPFGFIVVHRNTKLALFTGWVTDSAHIVELENDSEEDW